MLDFLITCNRCFNQYVGQTVDEFRHRWNNYKDNARKFYPGHPGFLNDVTVTFIDKADPKDPTKR